MASIRKVWSHSRFLRYGFASRSRLMSSQQLNPETVSYLLDKTQSREVYLLGTAHISKSSAEDVKQVIEFVKPDTIMVELCPERARQLRNRGQLESPEESVRRLVQEMFGRTGFSGFGSEMLLKVGLKSMYAILRQYGFVPGLEFVVAMQEADRLRTPLVYGDRSADETFRKLRDALNNISFSQFAAPPPVPPELERAFSGVSMGDISQAVEHLKTRKQSALLRDYLKQALPDAMDALVEQRDRIMTDALLKECAPGRTVAVVGMAHMDGIEREWEKRGGEVFLHEHNSLKTGR